MKTSHKFLIVLLALAFTGSFLVQNNAPNNEMNQASLISFSGGNSANPGPGTDAKINNVSEHGYLLPVLEYEGEFMPHMDLPVINIEGKHPRENVYPTIKVDGIYYPSILLEEVQINGEKIK